MLFYERLAEIVHRLYSFFHFVAEIKESKSCKKLVHSSIHQIGMLK